MFNFIDFMYTILFNEISNLLHEPKIDAVSIWISIWSMLIIIHLKYDLLLQTYINNYLKWREFYVNTWTVLNVTGFRFRFRPVTRFPAKIWPIAFPQAAARAAPAT